MASTIDTDPRTIPELIRELASETKTLFRREAELVRSELSAKAEAAKIALLAALSGLALAFSGILILLFGAVFGLGESMPMWCAALIVGAIASVAGVLLLKAGVPDDKPREKTHIEKSARETAQSIKEQLS